MPRNNSNPEANTATSEYRASYSRHAQPDLVADTPFTRQGTSGNGEIYDSAFNDLGDETDGKTGETPVLPIGLEARKDQQVDDVIATLSESDGALPPPFSKRELYQTAAEVGIPVWQPEQKADFRNRICDRLNYEWDPDVDQFVPVIGDHLVEILSTAAKPIAAALDAELPDSLHTRIDAWCDLHGFDTTDGETPTLVARQAVFGLLLKTTLYEWHSQRDELPPLHADTREALRLAGERLNLAAFDESVLDAVVWLADEDTLDAVIEARHRLLQSLRPAADIGRLYAALTPNESRRTLGQYRTPPEIGTLMRTWATSGDDVVLDPGIGAGALSSTNHPRWLIDSTPAHVDGIDRSPLAALMGTTTLTLSRQSHASRTTDFLDLSPDDLTADVDSIVCNPPYTRHQALSPEYKRALNSRTEQETDREIQLTSPLYAYFYYHARQFLSPGDRASLITPHHFLAADYGTSLKAYLLDEFEITALVLFDPDDESVFDEALTTGLVAFLQATDEQETPDTTRFIHVEGNPDMRTLLDAVRNGTSGSREWGSVNCLPQDSLTPEQNWRPLFDSCEFDTSHLTRLSEIADVTRGLSTGENDFFCRTQAEIDQWGLQKQHLSRLLRSPTNAHGYDYRTNDWERQRDNGAEVWLLYHLDDVAGVPETIPDSEAAAADRSEPVTDDLDVSDASTATVVEYLWSGLTEHETLPERAVIQTRSPWYRVERREPAPILVPCMRRGDFRAILNEAEVRYLNNVHGIYPDATIDETEIKALLAYLNSDFVDTVIRQHERTYAGGLDKIEPGDLGNVPVLDPRELPDEVIVNLAAAFDDLRDVARRDESEQLILDRIDATLQQAL